MSDNERLRAAALKYDPAQDGAPVLAAFGEGHVARRIIETAEESGVPVVPDKPLASMLAKLSVGDEIPAELYEIVAKVLLFVHDADSEYAKRLGLDFK